MYLTLLMGNSNATGTMIGSLCLLLWHVPSVPVSSLLVNPLHLSLYPWTFIYLVAVVIHSVTVIIEELWPVTCKDSLHAIMVVLWPVTDCKGIVLLWFLPPYWGTLTTHWLWRHSGCYNGEQCVWGRGLCMKHIPDLAMCCRSMFS